MAAYQTAGTRLAWLVLTWPGKEAEDPAYKPTAVRKVAEFVRRVRKLRGFPDDAHCDCPLPEAKRNLSRLQRQLREKERWLVKERADATKPLVGGEAFLRLMADLSARGVANAEEAVATRRVWVGKAEAEVQRLKEVRKKRDVHEAERHPGQYCLTWELTDRGRLHANVLMADWSYIPKDRLQEVWASVLGVPLGILYVTEVDNQGAVTIGWEVAKPAQRVRPKDPPRRVGIGSYVAKLSQRPPREWGKSVTYSKGWIHTCEALKEPKRGTIGEIDRQHHLEDAEYRHLEDLVQLRELIVVEPERGGGFKELGDPDCDCFSPAPDTRSEEEKERDKQERWRVIRERLGSVYRGPPPGTLSSHQVAQIDAWELEDYMAVYRAGYGLQRVSDEVVASRRRAFLEGEAAWRARGAGR